jgi:predicted nucleic-acid-binding protein
MSVMSAKHGDGVRMEAEQGHTQAERLKDSEDQTRNSWETRGHIVLSAVYVLERVKLWQTESVEELVNLNLDLDSASGVDDYYAR